MATQTVFAQVVGLGHRETFRRCVQRYLTLLYTGQRKSEVRALVWGDLHLDGTQPYALFRESTTKDKDKRAVPLRRVLADELRRAKPEDVSTTKRVFWFAWPTYNILRGDLKRAKIERKDGLGRVVHFHSFRKTWLTLGVRYGINQRAAQEVLGQGPDIRQGTGGKSSRIDPNLSEFRFENRGSKTEEYGLKVTK
jgi:integrase